MGFHASLGECTASLLEGGLVPREAAPHTGDCRVSLHLGGVLISILLSIKICFIGSSLFCSIVL